MFCLNFQLHWAPLSLFNVACSSNFVELILNVMCVSSDLRTICYYQRVLSIELKRRCFVWQITDDFPPNDTIWSTSKTIFGPESNFFPWTWWCNWRSFTSLSEAEPMTPAFSLKLLKCQFDQFGRKSPNQSLLRRSWNFLWNRTHRPELGAWCHMPVRSWGPTCGTYTTLDQAQKFPEIPFSRTAHSRDGTVSVSELLNRDLATVGWWT